jgi:hypothetical protein
MVPVLSPSVRHCNTWDHLTPSGAPRRVPNTASAHRFAASSYPFATRRATRCPALLRTTRRAYTDTATGQLAARAGHDLLSTQWPRLRGEASSQLFLLARTPELPPVSAIDAPQGSSTLRLPPPSIDITCIFPHPL